MSAAYPAAGTGRRGDPLARCRRAARDAAVTALALILAVAPAAAAELPAPFEAKYTGRRFPLRAEATLRLERLGDYLRYTMRASVAMGFYELTETYDCSVMQVQDGALHPLEYRHRDRRDGERAVRIQFDREHRRARVLRGNGSVTELEQLPSPAFDVMSIQVRLRADAPALGPEETREYAVVEKGGLRSHRVRRAGTESVPANGVAVQALKLAAESPRRTSTFWFAPAYGWLPVRMEVGGVTLTLASPPEEAARPIGPPPEEPPGCE
ncbi:MAG TPA: DUF3108 domain-containing protein [Burkholderiales bacterium]